MTNRDRWLDRTSQEAEDDQTQLFIALVEKETDGVFEARVNGRETCREAVASNEFGFDAAGAGAGDEVCLLTSPDNDLAQIIGLSSWSVH